MINSARPDDYDLGSHLTESSGKLQVLDKLLVHLYLGKHRVLIFSNFTSMLDVLEDYCAWKGWEYSRLDGSTPRVQRAIDIDAFNDPDSSVFVYLISTRAGGLGINLATADTVVHYDSDWNPQVDLQAQDRSHRIGQKRDVHVYRMVSEGTVEERIISRAEQKLYLDTAVTGGRNFSTDSAAHKEVATLGMKDLVPMLTFGADRIFKTSAADLSKNETIEEILQHSAKRAAKNSAASSSDSEQFPVPTPKKKQEPRALKRKHSLDAFKPTTISNLAIREFQGKSYEGASVKTIAQEWREKEREKKKSRDRKQRIVLQDGYRVLRENLAKTKIKNITKQKQKRRNSRRMWLHEDECFVCGADDEDEVLVPCARCPRVYHGSCLGLPATVSRNWSCSQHRCCECLRPASLAGGILFRCVSCPEAFCEDHVKYGMRKIRECERLRRAGYQRPHHAIYMICGPQCEALHAQDLAKLKEKDELKLYGKDGKPRKWKDLPKEERKLLEKLQAKDKSGSDATAFVSRAPAFKEAMAKLSGTSRLVDVFHDLLAVGDFVVKKKAKSKQKDEGDDVIDVDGDKLEDILAVKRKCIRNVKKEALAFEYLRMQDILVDLQGNALLAVAKLLGCKIQEVAMSSKKMKKSEKESGSTENARDYSFDDDGHVIASSITTYLLSPSPANLICKIYIEKDDDVLDLNSSSED
eukprot:TRINITY_DN4049_c0_g1_i1.p1 TRINITY_DN4049_c0_g1~~TRINITY_DN4049_c0_g1_i1.p1  ORF type:complete len:696 (-),score=185.24 TRINITY_DN4049_c0_g1_i1:45-2132(-)